MPVPDRTLLFFRDGSVEGISDTELQELPLWENGEFFAADSDRDRFEKRLRLYRERLAGITMQAGGHGITIADDGHIPVNVLRSCATPLPVTAAPPSHLRLSCPALPAGEWTLTKGPSGTADSSAAGADFQDKRLL